MALQQSKQFAIQEVVQHQDSKDVCFGKTAVALQQVAT